VRTVDGISFDIMPGEAVGSIGNKTPMALMNASGEPGPP
jgi:hypothetical protein